MQTKDRQCIRKASGPALPIAWECDRDKYMLSAKATHDAKFVSCQLIRIPIKPPCLTAPMISESAPSLI